MKLQRRDFLRLGMLQAISGSFVSRAKAESTNLRNGLSILQGATDDSRTQFSIVHKTGMKLAVHVVGSGGQQIQADSLVTKSFTGLGTEVTRVFFSGLRPNQDYTLRVADGSSGAAVDSRTFQSLDLDKTDLRFALCSCMDDADHEPKIWHDLFAQAPDVIFFIGDSVYSDQNGAKNLVPKPERLWRRFSEARQTLEAFYSQRLIPIIGTWDDHDFGENDSFSNYKYVKESQANYLTFFAQEPSHCSILQRGPGVSSAVTLAGHLFLLMDDRSFRLKSGSKDRYAQWGREQEEWALTLARQHPGPTWFFNGSQIFPQMIFKESVSGNHKVQFKGLLGELKKIQSKVIFGSGDVHFSEISQIEASAVGYPTYELTSSGFHSKHLPGVPDIIPNNRRIYSTGEHNYYLVEATAQGMGAVVKVVCRSKSGKVNFTAKLTV